MKQLPLHTFIPLELRRELPLALNSPALRSVAAPVDFHHKITPGFAFMDLVTSMLDCMTRHNGIGLAAPQVGIPTRIVVLDLHLGRRKGAPIEPVALANLEVEPYGRKIIQREGCLSLPGLRVMVERPEKCRVKACCVNSLQVLPVEFSCSDMLSRCLQHEYDHLQGRLISDYGEPFPWPPVEVTP